MSEINIFTETSEEKGLLYNSYAFLNDRISSFLDIIGNAIAKIKRDPLKDLSYIRKEIDTLKEDIEVDYVPEAINISDVKSIKKEIIEFRDNTSDLLDTYSKLRYKITAGGDYLHGIIMKSRLYSKDINPEHYDKINQNIRNIFRALDWTEKVLIDLLNMIDQDLNLLTIISTTYGRRKIFEYNDSSLVTKELINSKLDTTDGEIKQVKDEDVLSGYFLSWFLKNDDWKNDDPDKIDFDIFKNTNKNFVYGYYIDNKIEGLIRIVKMTEDRYEINMLYINPNIHNKGIGTKLMKYVIDLFGKYTMEVSVFVDNPRAVHLYEKFGFKTKHTIYITKDNCGNDTEFIGRTWYLKERPADKSVTESTDMLGDKLYFATSSKLDSETISVKAPRGLILYQTIRSASLNGINKDSIAKEYFESILAKNHKEIYSPKYTVIYGSIDQNCESNEPLTNIKLFHDVPSYHEIGSGTTHLYIYSVDISKIKYELNLLEDGWLYQGTTKLPISLINECDTSWSITYSKDIGTTGKIEIKDIKESTSDENLYRISSNGIGIYEVLKQRMTSKQWQDFLKSENCTWLPKPDKYLDGYKSYFTKAGIDKYNELVSPIVDKVIGNNINMEIIKISEIGNIIYQDQYQIIASSDKIEESVNNDYTLFEKYFSEKGINIDPSVFVREDINFNESYGNIRRYLYNEFINYAKDIRKKNTFESNYEEELFTKKFKFVPHEMQFFYRVANPILCVLNDNLCFFQLSELEHLNDNGHSDTDKTLIFAADLHTMIVFNMEDRKIYNASQSNNELILNELIADSFDKYIQQLIGRDDIL